MQYDGLTPKFFPLWVAGIVWFVPVSVGVGACEDAVTRERRVMWTWDRMVWSLRLRSMRRCPVTGGGCR